jgi:hypothetical protein
MDPDAPISPKAIGAGAVVFGIVLLGAAAGVVVWQWPWINDIRSGPAKVTAADLLKVADPAQLPNRYVTVPFDKSADLNLAVMANQTAIAATTSRFALLQVGDRWLVSEVPPGKLQTSELTGYLAIKPRGSFLAKAVVQAGIEHKGAPLLPYQLEAAKDQRTELYYLAGIVGFVALAGLLAICLGVSRMRQTDTPVDAPQQ